MKLLEVLFRRILSMSLSLIVVISLTFYLMDAVPGNFLEVYEQTQATVADGGEAVREYKKQFNSKFHLDKPVYYRVISYFHNLMQGDFGVGYKNQDVPMGKLVLEKLPVTAQVASLGLLLALVLGIPMGVIAALKKNTWIDYLLMNISMVGLVIPNYVVAVGLIIFFSIFVKNFEIGESFPLDFLRLPAGGWGRPEHLILPAIALGMRPLAQVARFIKASLLETLEQDFIRTARSKGLSKSRVINIHALRSSLIPVITVMGPNFAYMIVYSVLVEEVFKLPGLGRLFVTSMVERDTPMLVTVTLILSATVLLINFVVDLLYSIIDPRIELE